MEKLKYYINLIIKDPVNSGKKIIRRIVVLCKKIAFKLPCVSAYMLDKRFWYLAEVVEINKFSKTIIFENSFDWSGIMWQRPQQVACHMKEDILFFYNSISETNNRSKVKKIKDNLFLIDLNYYRDAIIKNIKNRHLMIYSTDYVEKEILVKYLKGGYKIIFEYVDDISEELTGKIAAEKLRDSMDFILKTKPYVVATASRLYNNIIEKNENIPVKLITNGCDYKHFRRDSGSIPKDLKRVFSNKPVLGYFGALASWFDYSLIKKICATDKFEIVLIGINYDDSLVKSEILNLKNVHYLGKKDYIELPDYLHYFDICIIPFIINEITLSTSPVKLFEYMSGNKPVVTTKLPECLKYKSIFVADNQDDFLVKLDKALEASRDPKYIELLDAEARANDWSNKCREYDEFIFNGCL